MHILWFRQDLRLADNPALSAAAKAGRVLPIYILDDECAGEFKMGGASRVWLHHALIDLNKALAGRLSCFSGNAAKILGKLCDALPVESVHWNRCYEPWRIQRDKHTKQALTDQDIQVKSYNGSLLWEPWEVLKKDGTPYKVFTPYYRRGCLAAEPPRQPLGRPKKITCVDLDTEGRDQLKGICRPKSIEQLHLLPEKDWGARISSHWSITEAAAHQRLDGFISSGIDDYKDGRNLPAKSHVSRLSPYLHMGHISPNQIWYELARYETDDNIDTFQSELGWREFSYSLLYHFPDLPRKNLQTKFDRFPWQKNDAWVHAWQKGETGIPIVDAGMRELWQTGYMHNRVRMIVGSFLVKNLLSHWLEGEAWFWDCLFDADLASNSASWQWIGGCGADAAPYFRIFNPVTQGEKFDSDGDYTFKYLPELKSLPKKYIYKPWEAPADVLKAAGVCLGENYPAPIVDLKVSRVAALDAFKSIKT